MRAYTFHSPSHRAMLERFLAPSAAEAGFDLHAVEVEQLCSTGAYYEDGWLMTMRRKLELLERVSRQHRNDVAVYSDCDVIFNAPNFSPDVALKDLGAHFLALQDDVVQYCCGFMILRGGDLLDALIAQTLDELDGAGDDQTALNRVLARRRFRVGRLPRRQYACVAQFPRLLGTDRLWNGAAVALPRRLKIFHANWTRGIPQKERLLSHVGESLSVRHRGAKDAAKHH